MTPLVPRWFLRTVAYCGGVLVVGVVAWALAWVLLEVALITVAVFVALLLAALLGPLARLLCRAKVPPAAAALLSLLALLAALGCTGWLVIHRVTPQLDNLRRSLTAAVGGIRNWLVSGPPSLQPRQVDQVRAQIVQGIRSAVPDGFAVASMALTALTGVAIALFVLFFLLKDGQRMWRWIVEAVPEGHRDRVDTAGRLAWETTSHYVVGVVIVALGDALGIGIGLFVIGVPLALTLTILVFLGAFVPLIGATVTGAVAVLVTLVTNGPTAALIVLALVLLVQNVEGHLLQPLVQTRAVRLHPVVILVAVTAGFLLFGIAGALVAVPLVAVTYRVAGYLRNTAPADTGPTGSAPTHGAPADGASHRHVGTLRVPVR